ncbi:MAG: SPOR domain-containing protein [Thiohalospira sp.]
MTKKVIILFLMIFSSFSLTGQNWNEIYYLESDAEYFQEEKNYEKAIEMYQKILKEIPNSSFIIFKIGLAYLSTDDQKEKAVSILEEASENVAEDFNPRDIRETRTPLEGYLYLGLAYQINNRLDNALSMYQKYKESISTDHYNYALVNQYIESCKNAKEMIRDPRRIQTQNLGNKVNDDFSNFNPVFSGDGNTMVFTSYTRNYIDIFMSKKDGDSWSSPKNITNQVSKKYYLKTSSLSFEGDELFLVTDDPDGNDIFVSYLEGRQWTNAKKMHKTISPRKSNETHASLSPDGNILYFTSNRDGGFGGLDIYKITRDEKGKWSDPENLGPEINTKLNEETPFVSHDGKYLYFSSQGHNSIGGYDVFYVDLENPVKAINFGYPVNTMADDLFFVPGESKNSGYMARVENDTQGKKDIYHINILPDIQFEGTIYNLAEGEVIDNKEVEIQFFDKANNDIDRSLKINNGIFSFNTGPGSYKISILTNDFESFEQEITIPENYDKEFFAFNAELKPVKAEQEFVADETQDLVKDEDESELASIIKTQEENEVEVKKEDVDKPEALAETKETTKSPIAQKEEPVIYQPQITKTGGKKTFSVQLMALKTPVRLSYFRDLENLSVTKYPDGFYRYTVGLTESYGKANQLKIKIHEKGYKDAFIKENNFATEYTIQIMALIVPVELTLFNHLTIVSVVKSSDDFYRYTIGNFSSYNEAKAELENIKKLGYEGAFIKKIIKDDQLAIQ